MKKFEKTINGTKYKGEMFEELDIINKFNRTQKDWELIDQYQKTFPQLLLKDTNDFVIDGETLWKSLGEPQGEYGKWATRKVENLFSENVDYIRFAKLVGTIKNNNGKKVNRHILTIECAKHLCMMTGSDKNSNEIIREKGQLIRSYFILMEDILKEYEKWSLIREPEKCGANDMRQAIKNWCERNNMDSTLNLFYTREFNMLNENLTGFKAVDIRSLKHISDNKTRDNLDIEVNNALHMLQFTNIALLNSDIGFDIRSGIIKNACDTTYKHIKDEFIKAK